MKIGYFRRICKLSDCLYDLQEMDVIMAFDDGEFKEIICTVQLEGLKEGTDIKYLIKKIFYGSKQAPRMWNKYTNAYFLSLF